MLCKKNHCLNIWKLHETTILKNLWIWLCDRWSAKSGLADTAFGDRWSAPKFLIGASLPVDAVAAGRGNAELSAALQLLQGCQPRGHCHLPHGPCPYHAVSCRAGLSPGAGGILSLRTDLTFRSYTELRLTHSRTRTRTRTHMRDSGLFLFLKRNLEKTWSLQIFLFGCFVHILIRGVPNNRHDDASRFKFSRSTASIVDAKNRLLILKNE